MNATFLLSLLLFATPSFTLSPESAVSGEPETFTFADVAPRQITITDDQGEAVVVDVPRGVTLDVTVDGDLAEIKNLPEGRSRVFEASGAMQLDGRRGDVSVFSLLVTDSDVSVAWARSNL